MPSDDRTRTLSPREIQAAEYERRQKSARRERQDLDDFMAEEIAIQNAERNGTDAFASANGKAILRHGNFKTKKQDDDAILRALSDRAIADGIHVTKALAALAAASDLSLSFAENAKRQSIARHMHEDKDYIYDTARASPDVCRLLDKEAAIIEEKLRELDAIADPALHEQYAKKITILAEEFQMRRHPVTQRYVHDINRVEQEEQRHNPHGVIECTGTVCVYRVKAQIGDLRGMKQQIGDVYNHDVAEAIATGGHLKGPQTPTPH